MTSSLNDLDEFGIVEGLVEGIPDLFSKVELNEISEQFAYFADGFAQDAQNTYIDNPEFLHEDADKIEALGRFFDAEVDQFVKSIRDHADNKGGHLDPPDEWGSLGSSFGHGGEACTDRDLDSMFGTLKD